jgi:hypothetical protein
MPDELPIACSLDADRLSKRLAGMSALGRSSLISAESTDRAANLRFRPGDDTAERLAAIVAAEAECCAFLAMDVRKEPNGLRLTIEAPDGAEPVLEEIVEAFRGGSEPVPQLHG